MRQHLLLCGALLSVCALDGCKKEPAPEPKPAPVAPAAPAPKVAPPTKVATPAPAAPAPKSRPAAAKPTGSAEAETAQPPPPAAAVDGPAEAEATVLKVRALRGTRTTIGSGGISRTSAGETSYEVVVGLDDGSQFSFLPLKNKLTKGSKVMVRYTVKNGQKTKPVLTVAVPSESHSISAEVLPSLKPSPVGDGTFSITFPSKPDETKTDLGVLHRYDYKFSKSYSPDSYYFFRTSVAEVSASPKFFKEQAASFLSLTGGTRIAVQMGGAKLDRKTGLKSATGRLSLEMRYIPRDGAIRLWVDTKKKVVYGAWVLAYSPNQLAAFEDMRSAFFGSFSVGK